FPFFSPPFPVSGVSVCLQTGGWTDESSYEAGEGAQRGRVNRHSLLPRLFDGCFFYLLGSFQKPPKSDLLQLLKEGGGQILTRQPKPDSDVTQTLNAAAYHARPGSDQALCTQYIIYDPQGSYRPPRLRLGKVWSAPSSWLLDCITSFQLLPVPEMVPSA
uniref:BRCT domain-containing protein n=1 Tax=Denticeps clupeoides TaxID=299321 RepID=A0AAY4EIK3_9TELE